MNAFNRIIVILLLVISLVVLGVVLFLSVVRLDASLTTLSNVLVFVRSEQASFYWMLFSVAVGLLLAACLLLLWLEIRRPRARAVEVQEIANGGARVAIDSIIQRLEYNIDRLQDVVSVRPQVKAKGSGVDVLVKLETAPEIDVPMKTEEIVQLTREVIEDQMGLKLHNVQVEITHAPYPEDVVR